MVYLRFCLCYQLPGVSCPTDDGRQRGQGDCPLHSGRRDTSSFLGVIWQPTDAGGAESMGWLRMDAKLLRCASTENSHISVLSPVKGQVDVYSPNSEDS
jgi:hypothetical protein